MWLIPVPPIAAWWKLWLSGYFSASRFSTGGLRDATKIGRRQCDESGFGGVVDADEIARLRRHHELGALAEMRSRPAVFGDDPLGQQVRDRLSMHRPIGAEDVIETAVLADDD